MEGDVTNTYHSIGLPCAPTTLAYHQPTSTLIAHAGPDDEWPPRNRLYFRRATDTRYQQIAGFADNISIDSFALDPSRPSLYLVTNAYEVNGGEGGAGGDWDGLFRFDLEQHRCEQLTRPGKLRTPAGKDLAWLSDILSVHTDGSTVFCTAGLATSDHSNLMRWQSAEYWLCELDLAGESLRPITRLEAVFA
jgi:hypothetical protein